jgi:hypothetical protein
MKKIGWLWLGGILMLISLEIQAQTYVESGLLFSRTRIGGSARIQSMGGAQVSLGGDYSSASSNPAGLGFFNRSEFTVTPAINFSTTSSDFYRGDTLISNSNKESRSNLNIPGLSVIFHNDFSDRSNSVISGNFAITLNRTNDFNQNFTYQGANRGSSIIDFYINDADNFTPDQLGGTTGLAFDNYLIDQFSSLNPNNPLYIENITNNPKPPDPAKVYYSFVQASDVPFQKEKVQTSGAQSQINLAYGINIMDKIYLGAGLGIASLRYNSTKTYSESFSTSPLSSVTLTENLNTSGSGVNLTIGTIYKPIPNVQLGLSASTPTWYTISDNYSATMNSTWRNFSYVNVNPVKSKTLSNVSAGTDELITNYNLATPFKINAGITYLIQKHGLITFEAEHLNYGKTSYTSATDGVSFDGDNQEIQSSYKSTFNFRGGGEYRLKNLRFRLGYNYMGDPYQSTRGGDRSITSLSGGAGYRTKTFYLDLTLISITGNTLYNPYSYGIPTSIAPVVKTANSNLQVMVTVGFPF